MLYSYYDSKHQMVQLPTLISPTYYLPIIIPPDNLDSISRKSNRLRLKFVY